MYDLNEIMDENVKETVAEEVCNQMRLEADLEENDLLISLIYDSFQIAEVRIPYAELKEKLDGI